LDCCHSIQAFRDRNETRLNSLYNTSKHMADRIRNGKIPPEATSGIWLTNTGLESKEAVLSFDELVELLSALANDAEGIISGK
jgi:hypothetical protein